MEKAEERKQVLDVGSRLDNIRSKVALLHDAVAPVGSEDHYNGLTYEGAEGLGLILDEIGEELEEIENIVHQPDEPLPLRKEA